MEERRLIMCLETESLSYDGFHDYIGLRIRGRLPADRAKMLTKLDAAIEKYGRQEPVYALV